MRFLEWFWGEERGGGGGNARVEERGKGWEEGNGKKGWEEGMGRRDGGKEREEEMEGRREEMEGRREGRGTQ